MESKDLRIGNLLENMGDIIKVEYLDKSLVKGVYHRVDTYNTSIQLKQCNPILLTEEWLRNMGFTGDGNMNILVNSRIILEYDSHYNTVELYSLGFKANLHLEVKYVHQLQNIYFALSGEEISFNGGIQGKNDK